MHGLETIQRMNAVARVHTAALHTPCEAEELADITEIVQMLRGDTREDGDMYSRAADYLVASYGIEE
jgi:hypothetical protein